MNVKNSKGTATVEFVFILVFILTPLLLGTIEFGLLLYDKQVLTNASREGARFAISGTGVTEVQQVVADYCNNNLINLGGDDALNVSDIYVETPDADNDLMVSVSYVYNFLFAGIIGLDNTTLTARTVMRME